MIKILLFASLALQLCSAANPSDVKYYLYTQATQTSPVIIEATGVVPQLTVTAFSQNRKNIFVVHGWMDDYTAGSSTTVRNAVLAKYDYNVFLVDWSPLAKQGYSAALAAMPDVGALVAQGINEVMESYQLPGTQFVVIGHSMGAHIAGIAGSKTEKPLDYIIGLDPAGQGIDMNDLNNRLDPGDANYVQAIHTNGKFLGIPTSVGHADFYPNGGMEQPGCGIDILGACAHARSFEYFGEAAGGDKFTATACDTYANYEAGKCNNNKKTPFGIIPPDSSVKGDYFLKTNDKSPFGQG